mgnify:CR=1 FL=1
MRDINKLHQVLENQISLVNEVLIRYTEDEVGENQKQKFLEFLLLLLFVG